MVTLIKPMQMFYLIVFLGLIEVRLLTIIKIIVSPMSVEQQERTAEGMLINFMMKSFQAFNLTI
jgi:hypothetical protein